MKPAGLGIRSIANAIDGVIVFGIWVAVAYHWGAPNSEGNMELTGSPALWLVLGTATYLIVPEWLAGTSFGKWVCGLRVANKNGKRISLMQSAKRNLARFLDMFAMLGLFVANSNPNRQRIGDIWAKTFVVKSSEIKRQTESDSANKSSTPELS